MWLKFCVSRLKLKTPVLQMDPVTPLPLWGNESNVLLDSILKMLTGFHYLRCAMYGQKHRLYRIWPGYERATTPKNPVNRTLNVSLRVFAGGYLYYWKRLFTSPTSDVRIAARAGITLGRSSPLSNLSVLSTLRDKLRPRT